MAFARVTWDRQPDQITAADADSLIAAAQAADGPDAHVSLGGASITNSERAKPGPSVVVGVVAALIILLIVFGGAILAALTPLAGAALALVIGSSAITLLSHALTIATALTLLPALLGFLGPRVLSRRERAALAGNGPARVNPPAIGARWARLVERHRVATALASLAAITLIALPVAGLRLGTSDALPGHRAAGPADHHAGQHAA